MRLGASYSTLESGESLDDIQSPPMRGRWPAGQRGVFKRHPLRDQQHEDAANEAAADEGEGAGHAALGVEVRWV